MKWKAVADEADLPERDSSEPLNYETASAEAYGSGTQSKDVVGDERGDIVAGHIEQPLEAELFGRKARSDQAIRAIYEMYWIGFDDFHSHKLDGKYALNDETRPVAHRCLLFLQSDIKYRPKEARFIKAGGVISNLLTLGLTRGRLSIEEQLAAHLDQQDRRRFCLAVRSP